MYFDDCRTADEIKARYRELAKRHHPDLGGNTATMQAVNAEYAFVIDKATRAEKPGKTDAEYADLAAVLERLRAAIEAVITLPGIKIEICGLWVWVDGDTRPVKETLKAAGYRWAPKKGRWYYAAVASSSRGGWDMEEIRGRYGSQAVPTRPRVQLDD